MWWKITTEGTPEKGTRFSLGVAVCTKANKQKELGFEHIRDAEDTVDRMDQKMIHDKKI